MKQDIKKVIDSSVEDSVWDSAEESVWGSVWDSIEDSVSFSVITFVRISISFSVIDNLEEHTPQFLTSYNFK